MNESYKIEKISELKGHNGWITAIATVNDEPNMFVSASRDKTLLKWRIVDNNEEYAVLEKRLIGHSHIVQDVTLSSDGKFALSSSWDNSLRLWNLKTGETARKFVGHTNDVISVAFSPDNRQIVSGSRDKTIKLWNTLGQCKFTIEYDCHSDWVSCVRFSPNTTNPLIVSGGCDKLVKVWNLTDCKLRADLVGHTAQVNIVTVSPDGSLCASGGRDGMAMLWDLNESRHLSSLNAGDNINYLCFSPNRYWLCAATSSCIKIWDLEKKKLVDDLFLDSEDDNKKSKKAQPIECISLAWSHDGSTLFAGYTDKIIRVWKVRVFGE